MKNYIENSKNDGVERYLVPVNSRRRRIGLVPGYQAWSETFFFQDLAEQGFQIRQLLRRSE
jgi:hypothetical protein